jgi:WD40 repeat protein
VPDRLAVGSVPDGDGALDVTEAAPAVAKTLPVASSADLTELPTVDRSYYHLGAELARGGMGRIIAARDRRTRRPVALKVLLEKSGDLAARFEREVLIPARLQHPAIVPVYEAGKWDNDEPFYAMKKVDGLSFDKVIDRAETLRERVGLLPNVIAVADALAYAHSQRIIHRDLKPANVLIGDFGETVVIDWGLAKDLSAEGDDIPPHRGGGGDDGLTVLGAAMGTPSYMPPEQARGDRADERADVYAIGAMLYHVLAGVRPYANCTSVVQAIDAVKDGPPEPLRGLVARAPADLLTVVDKAMARDPKDRYADAGELARDLKRFERGQLVSVHEYSIAALAKRWIERHRATFTVAVSLLAVLIIASGWFLVREQGLRRNAEEERDRADALRVVADGNLTRANENTLTLLIEQGIAKLADNRPMQAAALLSEAYSRSKPGHVLPLLLAEAMRSVDVQLVTFDQHRDVVYSADFSPDGNHVVTASHDGSVIVWAAEAGRSLFSLEGHRDRVQSASYSPSGDRIITASRDKTVKLWDAKTGKLLSTLDHPAATTHATFGPDGRTILTVGGKAAYVWDLASSKIIVTLEGHDKPVLSAAFSADGASIVTASYDRTARIWDAKTGRERATLRGHEGELMSARFSPDGKHIVTASLDNTASIWNVATGEVETTLDGHTSGVASAVYSADGARIVTASFDSSARMWDAASGTHLATFDGHTSKLWAAAFSSDGRRIVTAGYDQTAKIWDASVTRRISTLAGHSGAVLSVAYSPDGRLIATGGHDKTAAVWNAATGERVLSFSGHTDYVRDVYFSPDGRRVVSASFDKTAVVWDAATGEVSTSLAHPSFVLAAEYSPDGKHIVTASLDATGRVWDVASGEQVLTLDGHDKPLQTATYSPDGRYIATSSYDKSIKIWSATSGELLQTLERAPGLLSVGWHPNSVHIVATNNDGTATVWKAVQGQHVMSIDGAAGVWFATYSSDGNYVLTTSGDRAGDVSIWDAETGQLLTSLRGHHAPVLVAAYDPKGRSVATASEDGTTNVWDVRLETRSPEQIAQIVRDKVAWRLKAGRLVLGTEAQ